jgi:2-Cys peroxiredoxin 5
MAAWGEQSGATGKVRMLADPKAELAKALGLELDLTEKLGNVRIKRFSAIVDDGVVKSLNVEPEGGGLTCSLSNVLLQQLYQ